MKLSKETINLFKNFSSINTNLLIEPGNNISTKSAKKTILADAVVAETFPVEFGIYDLNEFLGAMTLFESPILEFEEKYVTITEESNTNYSIRFYKAEKSVLVYKDKPITFPESYIDFDLSASVLLNIQRSAAVLHADVVSVIGDGSQVTIQVGKQKQEANSYQNIIGPTTKKFKVNILIEHFRMVPGDYAVSIHPKITRFKSSSDLVYYIAVETDSTFD